MIIMYLWLANIEYQLADNEDLFYQNVVYVVAYSYVFEVSCYYTYQSQKELCNQKNAIKVQG